MTISASGGFDPSKANQAASMPPRGRLVIGANRRVASGQSATTDNSVKAAWTRVQKLAEHRQVQYKPNIEKPQELVSNQELNKLLKEFGPRTPDISLPEHAPIQSRIDDIQPLEEDGAAAEVDGLIRDLEDINKETETRRREEQGPDENRISID